MNKPFAIILIIEDSEDDIDLYNHYLQSDKHYQWEINEAFTGEEGIRKYSPEEIDCVLIDFSLPKKNGIEVLKQLYKINPHVAAIMLTGQGNETIAVQSMQEGAIDYLVKSELTAESLQISVKNALEKSRLNQALLKQQQEMANFGKVLARDLKKPATEIDSCIQNISSQLQAEDRVAIEHASHKCKQMVHLIDKLYAYTKVDVAKKDFEPCNILVLLEEFHKEYALQDEIDSRCPVIEFQDTVDVSIPGDKELLSRMFKEIISNAIQFNISEVPNIKISMNMVENDLLIQIIDNGIGMQPGELNVIFNPFVKVENPLGNNGSGLGLATAKKIAIFHDADIWCESAINIGSIFSIRLPAK